MSSSPTVRTSTTVSSTSSPSRSERPTVALVACGALAQAAAQVIARTGWPVDVHPLPPLLHNQPHLIAGRVESAALQLLPHYASVAVGYADCGTYGALDDVCNRLALRRLQGLHCYDVYGGRERMQRFFAEQPGTYVLTDFLVRSFGRTVRRELGLDRFPELRDSYFGNYTRVVWLAQQPDEELHALAVAAADELGLPLTVVDTGTTGLERELAALVGGADRQLAAPIGPPRR
ncbi:MAG: DUF1638 domain-containing protein, partial [Actinomycetes bacterium]